KSIIAYRSSQSRNGWQSDRLIGTGIDDWRLIDLRIDGDGDVIGADVLRIVSGEAQNVDASYTECGGRGQRRGGTRPSREDDCARAAYFGPQQRGAAAHRQAIVRHGAVQIRYAGQSDGLIRTGVDGRRQIGFDVNDDVVTCAQLSVVHGQTQGIEPD